MDEDADRVTPYDVLHYVPGREQMTKVLRVNPSAPMGEVLSYFVK